MTTANASEAEKASCVVGEEGALVFPATVRAVSQSGVFELKYDEPNAGRGYALLKDLRPRVCMPSHPKFINGQYAMYLHRNVPHDKDIEDVPVRWIMCRGTWER